METELKTSDLVPESWKLVTVALLAIGHSLPYFLYSIVSYAVGILIGIFLTLYIGAIVCTRIAAAVGWDSDSGVFSNLSQLVAAACLLPGFFRFPPVVAYFFLMPMVYGTIQIFIMSGGALLSRQSSQ